MTVPSIRDVFGLQKVEPLQPAVRALFDKVKDFQARVRNGAGAAADRARVYERVDGWLIELKMLSLIAYEYKERHDFYDVLCWNGYFGVEPLCPEGVDARERCLFENNLVMTSVRREIESFHLYASILLNKIPRIFPAYFGQDRAVGSKLNHEKLWREYRQRGHVVPYLTPEVAAEAAWLQNHMDWFRNRVITHPEGYEDEGFVFRGLKNRKNENVRLFLRKNGDASTNFQDQDRESATLEEIVPHLVAYVAGIIDSLDDHAAESILTNPSPNRPELVATTQLASEEG
jgi:hypothetical protein